MKIKQATKCTIEWDQIVDQIICSKHVATIANGIYLCSILNLYILYTNRNNWISIYTYTIRYPFTGSNANNAWNAFVFRSLLRSMRLFVCNNLSMLSNRPNCSNKLQIKLKVCTNACFLLHCYLLNTRINVNSNFMWHTACCKWPLKLQHVFQVRK